LSYITDLEPKSFNTITTPTFSSLEIKYNLDEGDQLSSQYQKIDVVQTSDFKYVFVARCTQTSNLFILKELSCPAGKHGICHLTVEPMMLQQIHANGEFPGIIRSPETFYEHVRVSLVYEMMSMDLFAGIEDYANINRLEGVNEEIAIIWLAQLLVTLQHMQSRRIIHRDLKPEVSDRSERAFWKTSILIMKCRNGYRHNIMSTSTTKC